MILHILNGKEVKSVKEKIREQWDCSVFPEEAYAQTTAERILLVSRDLDTIDFSTIKMDSIGVYFCEIKNDTLRLSIEGSQRIGPHARKNVVEVTKEEMRVWLKGQDLHKKTDCTGFVIIKYLNDYLGCGRVREEIILNFVPKTRRIMAND